jgi:hypothetical protein
MKIRTTAKDKSQNISEANDSVVELVESGKNIKDSIRSEETMLQENIQSPLIEFLSDFIDGDDTGTIHITDEGEKLLDYSVRNAIKITDMDRLKEVLGFNTSNDRFSLLVKTYYTPTKRLMEALDLVSPLEKEEILKCIDKDQKHSFSWGKKKED